MKRTLALAFAAAAVLATPVLAGPPSKRPQCQFPKAQSRDAKRSDYCRRQAIPPVVDPTPLFLVSTNAPALASSEFS